MDFLGDNDRAIRLSEPFMKEIVANLDNDWRLTGDEVAAALGTQTHMNFLGSSELLIDSAASFGVNVGSTSYAGPQLQSFVAGGMFG